MALPRKLFDEAIGHFGRKFLFVYRDADGRYGICSECGNTVDYEDIPLPSAQGGDRFRYTECPHCGLTLEVRRGWYGKNSLKARFYLQAWEVIDHDTVKLHEAIVALDGRTDTEEEAGSWMTETCWDQRCTTLTPGHAETVRWNGDKRRVASMCTPFEMCGCNIIPTYCAWKMMTDQICVMGWSKLKNSFIAPYVRAYEETGRRQENAPNFIFRMVEEPITELFYKAGYYEIAKERAYKHRPNLGTRHIDFSQKSPKKMFRGLGKGNTDQKMKELLRILPKSVRIWQLEKCVEMFRSGILKKAEDAALFCKIDTYEYAFDSFLEEIKKYNYPAARFIRYLGSCGEQERYYTDYLEMCEELGRPMNEQRVLFPENLRDAHDECVAEKKNIYSKKMKELAKHRRADLTAAGYEFRSGTILAVVPENAKEIKREGKKLHHCVGGYAEKHANGTTNIIFIRRAEKPNEPWFTLEVNPKTLDFVQCYGLKNQVRGKDDPEVGPFLKKYAKHLERCAAKNKTRKQEDNKCRKTA